MDCTVALLTDLVLISPLLAVQCVGIVKPLRKLLITDV